MICVPIRVQVSYSHSGVDSEKLYIRESSGWKLGFTSHSGRLSMRSRSGLVGVLFGSCAGPVRVLVGSCSGHFQMIIRSCSNPIEVHSFIPSQIYKTIRYSLYSSSAWGYLKPFLICILFLSNYLQNISLSMEPHHIVLSTVTGLPPILPGSHKTIRLYHRHLSSVDVSEL